MYYVATLRVQITRSGNSYLTCWDNPMVLNILLRLLDKFAASSFCYGTSYTATVRQAPIRRVSNRICRLSHNIILHDFDCE